jgi:hypothetical protein
VYLSSYSYIYKNLLERLGDLFLLLVPLVLEPLLLILVLELALLEK